MARLFNGSTDGINLSLPAAYPNSNGPVSLAAWFYYNNTGNDGIIFVGNAPGTEVVELRANRGSNGKFNWRIAFNQTDSGTTTASRLNLWTTVLGTYDGGSSQIIYINGVQDGSISSTGYGGNVVGGWGIGRDFVNSANTFSGVIAEAAMWGAVLNAQEAYALGTGALRPYQIRPQKLLGYWTLDGYGHPALDRGIIKNNGVLTGTTFAPGPPLLSAAPILTMPPSNQAMSPIMFVPPPAFILMPQIVM
jgi:hypothetical protein